MKHASSFVDTVNHYQKDSGTGIYSKAVLFKHSSAYSRCRFH